jgi:hypothetical protein
LLCACARVSVSPIVVRQRLGKNPAIVARQWLGKNALIGAKQRLGRNVTAVTNTHAIDELLDASFSMWPVTYQGKYVISSSQNFLLLQLNNNNGHITDRLHVSVYFERIWLNTTKGKNIFGTKVVEKNETHILYPIPFFR